MAEAGDGASSGSRSSGCAARPGCGLRPSNEGAEGRRREGREGEGLPVEGRWTSKSNCAASGRAEGESDLLVLAGSEPGSLLSPEPRSRHRPRGPHREPAQSTAANQSQPAGHPCPRPCRAFQEWLAHSLLSVSEWPRGGTPEGIVSSRWGT